MLLRSGRITKKPKLPSYAKNNCIMYKGIATSCIRCGRFLNAIKATYHIVCDVIIVQCSSCLIYNCCDIAHLSAQFILKPNLCRIST